MTDTTYKIVLFLGEFDDKGKPVVEIVPTAWVRLVDNIYQCWFPEITNHNRVQKLIRQSFVPDNYDESLYYPVEIKSEAIDYTQGLRRLQRVCETLDAVSSCSENDADRTNSTRSISVKIASTMLKTSQSLFSNQSTPPVMSINPQNIDGDVDNSVQDSSRPQLAPNKKKNKSRRISSAFKQFTRFNR